MTVLRSFYCIVLYRAVGIGRCAEDAILTIRECSVNADVFGSSDMLPGQTRVCTIREHCAQLFPGYRVTGGVLPADPDSHGHEPSECTQHGDELRIANNHGNEPWKRLCSNMGPTLDDDDDDDDDEYSVVMFPVAYVC